MQEATKTQNWAGGWWSRSRRAGRSLSDRFDSRSCWLPWTGVHSCLCIWYHKWGAGIHWHVLQESLWLPACSAWQTEQNSRSATWQRRPCSIEELHKTSEVCLLPETGRAFRCRPWLHWTVQWKHPIHAARQRWRIWQWIDPICNGMHQPAEARAEELLLQRASSGSGRAPDALAEVHMGAGVQSLSNRSGPHAHGQAILEHWICASRSRERLSCDGRWTALCWHPCPGSCVLLPCWKEAGLSSVVGYFASCVTVNTSSCPSVVIVPAACVP